MSDDRLLSAEELDAAFTACTTAAPRIHHIRNLRGHIAALTRELEIASAWKDGALASERKSFEALSSLKREVLEAIGPYVDEPDVVAQTSDRDRLAALHARLSRE